MHPRNPYRIPPDFRQLAQTYPPLQPCLVPSETGFTIDFKDEVAQKHLTEALLHRDFGISLSLPPGRLCPPVPNRLNYVLWIQDILQATGSAGPVHGVDIGTGASAIYPLLACKLEPDWSFITTDVDDVSLASARSNLAQNGLLARVDVVPTTTAAPVFAALSSPHARFDFTMCNPPFYSSLADVAASADAKALGPSAVCTGAYVEMITPGGESVFVRRMIDESVELGERCRWYTSMLGKMSSLTDVISALRERGVDNYGITEFVQGTTRRWAVAWSFSDLRLPDTIARIANPHLQGLMPPRNTLRQPVPPTASAKDADHPTEILSAVLASVEGARIVADDDRIAAGDGDRSACAFMVHAAHNTWSRGARRKQLRGAAEPPAPNPSLGLVCGVRWVYPASDDGAGRVLECRWVRGRDRALFESFASHVGRKVAAALTTA